MTDKVKLVAFDLDDTLAPSKSQAPPRIIELLLKLLAKTQVAVISGGNFEQFKTQLLDPLQREQAVGGSLDRLHLLPTCGTKYFKWENKSWVAKYEENLTLEERISAARALETEAQHLGLWEALTWGEIIEDRGSQVTFSALGQRAPIEAKELWDPNNHKKNALQKAVQLRLPDLEVRSGGSTSVDVTKKGIDKAYGMEKLASLTGIPLESMFFIGDRLDPEGNDYPVKALGVATHEVSGWEETADYLEQNLL